MILVFLVLACVFAIVSIVNYTQCENQVYSALERQATQNQQPQENIGAGKAAQNVNRPPNNDLVQTPQEPREMKNDQIVAASTFEVDPTGNITGTIGDLLSLDEDVRKGAISESCQKLTDQSQAKGFLDSYKLYFFAKNLNGKTIVSFASQNYVYTSMAGLVLNLGLSCACALIVFFIISFFLAKWALRPAEKAWAQQSQFIADASHELKTPLTVILANMSILKKELNGETESEKWISSTESEAKDMQVLVEDMLELAKAESQEKENTFKKVDFSKIVESCALHFESVAFENGNEIEETIEPDAFVKGDEAQLKRLVSTLIENACKYSNNTKNIEVKLRNSINNCELIVSNPSAKIKEEELAHMFDRFYRADKSRTGQTQSYGLGLSIAKEIVNSHKGEISVSSEDDFTTFTVKLPKA